MTPSTSCSASIPRWPWRSFVTGWGGGAGGCAGAAGEVHGRDRPVVETFMTALEFMNDAYSPQYYEYAYNMAAPSGPSRRCVTLVISRGHRDFGELGMRMAGDTMGVEGVNERLMTVDQHYDAGRGRGGRRASSSAEDGQLDALTAAVAAAALAPAGGDLDALAAALAALTPCRRRQIDLVHRPSRIDSISFRELPTAGRALSSIRTLRGSRRSGASAPCP